MSTFEQRHQPAVQVLPPEEALRRARPLPRREDLVVEDVTDDEWAALLEALTES